jgi:hypothetical protein
MNVRTDLLEISTFSLAGEHVLREPQIKAILLYGRAVETIWPGDDILAWIEDEWKEEE